MTIGDCAEAGPAKASAATDAAARINFACFLPDFWERANCAAPMLACLRHQYREAGMQGYCPLAGALPRYCCCNGREKRRRRKCRPAIASIRASPRIRAPALGMTQSARRRRRRHVALALHDDLVERAEIGLGGRHQRIRIGGACAVIERPSWASRTDTSACASVPSVTAWTWYSSSLASCGTSALMQLNTASTGRCLRLPRS